MGRVRVYAILSKHFTEEDAEVIMDYIDEKKSVTIEKALLPISLPQTLPGELKLEIMKKIFKTQQWVMIAFAVNLFLTILIFFVLGNAIVKLAP